MDFDLSEEQLALQEVARDFLGERWPADRMREALDRSPASIDDEVWKELVSMGWLGVAAPEEVGGIGGDVLTAAVLSEEAGRGLLPGPFHSNLLAAIALDRSGEEGRSLLADLVAGRKRVSLAVEEPGGSWGPDAVALQASAAGEGWSLDGTKILVPDAEVADILLVAARAPQGLGLLLIDAKADGVTVNPMRRMDAQSISELVLEGVQVAEGGLLGGEVDAERVLRESYEIGTVLCAADLLGTAQACLDLSTDYAKERVQFDRPIGSFQAISHKLADVLVEVEIGRSLLYAACLALDEARENAPAYVSAAKSWLSDAAVHAAEAALQVHGGVGFTWEYDVQLYLRRARVNAASFGDAEYHRNRVADFLDEEMAVGE